jgi:hypothetical protein
MEEAMKNVVRKMVYVGFILLICFYLSPWGCHKKGPTTGHKSGQVEGYVKDAIDSTSIVGAGIFAGTEPDTALLITKTDSTGYYKFGSFIGALTITARAEGYKPQTKTVTIKENQIQRLDFLLERAE